MTTAQTGRILRIDLSSKRWREMRPTQEDYCQTIGGRALGLRILAPELEREPDDPALPLGIFTGPLTGLPVPACSRACVISRSPLTRTVAISTMGGQLPTRLKQAGWDGIIFTGRADSLTAVHIENDHVEFLDASPLAQLTTDKVFRAVERTKPRNAATACIGPAAENGSPMACIVADGLHRAGRGGLGAILALKNLKFFNVAATGKLTPHNPDALETAAQNIMRLVSASPVIMGKFGMSEWGTSAFADLTMTRSMMPTDNFRRTHFNGFGRCNGPALKSAYGMNKTGCEGCPVRCKQVADDGRPLPEFDALSHLSALVGISDPEAIMEANAVCLNLGLDPVSAASTLACHREITGEEFTPDEIVSRIKSMAYGSSMEMGMGARTYAEKCGMPQCAMTVKGLALPALDPRGAMGNALAMAVNTRGGCALHAWAVSHEVFRKPVASDRFSFSGKARMLKLAEDAMAALDSLGVCRYMIMAAGPAEYAPALAAAAGRDIFAPELLRAGEEACMAERTLNAQYGFTAAHDDLPERFFSEHGTPASDFAVPPIDREQFLAARSAYYMIRGLDVEGMPKTPLKQDGDAS